MANEMRDRLVELIQNAVDGCASYWAELIADHLIENGVVVPPVKVGYYAWFIKNDFVQNNTVALGIVQNITINGNSLTAYVYEVDEHDEFEDEWCVLLCNLFPTKAEAEQKLKEMRG